MDWRLRRPSSVVDIALRARRDALTAAKASPSRRASMASFMATAPGFKVPVVERIVMFKLNQNANSNEVAQMLEALQALRKMDGVQELTVGLRFRTCPGKLLFAACTIDMNGLELVQGGDYTHVFHGRFRDKKALGAFSASPDHAAIVRKFMRTLTEDSITTGWECRPSGPFLASIMAKRITLVKVKDEISAADMRFLEESIPRHPSSSLQSAGRIFPS